MDRKLLYKRIFDQMLPKQKQYEALRMLATTKEQEKSLEEIAKIYNYRPQSLRNLFSLAVHSKINFFVEEQMGPKEPRLSRDVINKMISLRKDQLMSVQDIQNTLNKNGSEVSITTINRILSNAGFLKLPRRTDIERGITRKNTLVAMRAKNLDFDDLEPFNVDCPVAGVFLFIPYIIESGILEVVRRCELPKSRDLGSTQAALAMLLLKLIGNERLSSINSFDHEPAFGIFAGSNAIPKASYIGSYSCRTSEHVLNLLQQEMLTLLKSKYPYFYTSKYINIDFHGIPHFGTESEMEKIWCGARGKAMKGANTLFAQDSQSNAIIYTKADILRKNEAEEIKHFISFWKKVKGQVEETLVFDCKLTKYGVLNELDLGSPKIKFITLRKRNKNIIEETDKIPIEKWKKVHLDIPKRKHKKFYVFETKVTLKGCRKAFRQIIVHGHGREKPTFIITNDHELDLIKVLEVYAKRWHIENKLSELVSFFNLNALSSPIMIRIHFDIFWTMVADTLYRLFAKDLSRFENCRANTLFKKFINFPGRLKYDGKTFTVTIRKRAHTPIILGIPKLNAPMIVPWLDNKYLKIEWTA